MGEDMKKCLTRTMRSAFLMIRRLGGNSFSLLYVWVSFATFCIYHAAVSTIDSTICEKADDVTEISGYLQPRSVFPVKNFCDKVAETN